MKKFFEFSDLSKHIENTLNRVLYNEIEEIKFCCEQDDSFRKWWDDKFCKYLQKVDAQDIYCLLDSLNGCLGKLKLEIELLNMKERQHKEAEDFAERVRCEVLKTFCDLKGYDFKSGMGTYFFVNKAGDVLEREDIKHPTIMNLLDMELHDNFALGEYVRSYTPKYGYTAKRIKDNPEFCEERGIKLSL